MKQVRKSDLESLITDFYCKFIAHISEKEHDSLSCDERVKVSIKSTHIVVWWYYDEDLEITADTISCVKNFAKEIENVTFGNLKVTYFGIGTAWDKTTLEMYIANAYEVIE